MRKVLCDAALLCEAGSLAFPQCTNIESKNLPSRFLKGVVPGDGVLREVPSRHLRGRQPLHPWIGCVKAQSAFVISSQMEIQ